MSKYTISLTVTYELKGKILKEYLEWLDDYRDTEAMRKSFVIDRFIGHDNYAFFMESNIIDRKSKLIIKKEKGNE
jgi:hypothetical protein